jgi:hypothetical protein
VTKILCTFSGEAYHETTQRIVEDGPKFGAEKVWVYDDIWLRDKRPAHWEQTKAHREHPQARGVNWFAFKPFVILDAVDRMADGDILLFTDADTYPIHDLSILFDIGRRDGIMLFEACGWFQKQWCTQATFSLMGLNPEDFYEKPHGCARFMVFTKAHRPFLVEWLTHCLDIRCTTFDPRPEFGPEHPEFRQHRCEQAIMTNLAHKYGHKLYREACQFGEGWPQDRDLYPQLFFQNGSHTWRSRGNGSEFRNIND